MCISQRQFFVSFFTIAGHLAAVAGVTDLLLVRSISVEKPHWNSVSVRLFAPPQRIPDKQISPAVNRANLRVKETNSKIDKVNVEGVRQTVFYGPKEIDKRALPLSEPDSAMLTGIPNNTGLPIRIRLYIDQYGAVFKTETLQNHPDDAPIVEKIIIMMKQTAFMPAKRSGLDVGSYQDLEFDIATLAPIPPK